MYLFGFLWAQQFSSHFVFTFPFLKIVCHHFQNSTRETFLLSFQRFIACETVLSYFHQLLPRPRHPLNVLYLSRRQVSREFPDI